MNYKKVHESQCESTGDHNSAIQILNDDAVFSFNINVEYKIAEIYLHFVSLGNVYFMVAIVKFS